ncbi:MAG TPA: hypothetical protein VHI13_14555 [Candidatus Kapabacteria bacterium]|nr:hypothetical protein [Candidatus Kapabacteria bacterium]
MKTSTIARLFTLVIVALAVNAAVAGAVTVKYIIGNGGTMSWNHSTGDDCGCPNEGGGCKIEITMSVAKLNDNGNGTWHVEGTAQKGLYDITFPEVLQHPFANLGGYVFGSGFFTVNDGDFQGVPGGTRINLSGVQTDAAGNFVADVPR